MKITLIKENEDNDKILLDKYYKTKSLEEGEILLDENELVQKKEIWSLAKMETMVSNDETLTNRYSEMALDGSFKFGYHWNEVIMNILFNDYVLQDNRYMEKYLNTVTKEKKRRGNPDGEIKKTDFKDQAKPEIEPNKNLKEMEINDDNIRKVRDINSDEYQFISDSQDVDEYKNYIGGEEANEYDSFFVKFTPDGDVVEIWGMSGIIGYLNKNVYLVYPAGINETTSTGASSGQYSGPAIWATDEKNMRFAKKPMYVGGQIVEGIKYYESILKGLNEDKKTPSMVNKDRIGKENKANFTKDLQNNNIAKIVKDLAKVDNVVKVEDTKSHSDLEADQLKKMKDFKPVKHERSDEHNDNVKMIRGYGMQDIKYDIEPTERFEERAKEDMGEELYDHGKEKIEFEKNKPMYNKEPQPVENIKESYYISGKYTYNKKTSFIEFDVNNVATIDKINENHVRVYVDGMGNRYDNKSNIVENVKNEIEKYAYFIEPDSKVIFKNDRSINETSFNSLDSFKKLANYSSFKAMRGK